MQAVVLIHHYVQVYGVWLFFVLELAFQDFRCKLPILLATPRVYINVAKSHFEKKQTFRRSRYLGCSKVVTGSTIYLFVLYLKSVFYKVISTNI